MKFKYYLSALIILSISLKSIAQKVKRKAVTQKQENKKEPVAKYYLYQLNGKWQEVKRIPRGSKRPVDFSDSLLMYFENGKAELRDATSMRVTVKGDAEIEAPCSLMVAGDIYTIRSLDNSTLIVDDGELIRELQKKEQFYYETLGKIKVEKDSFSSRVNIDINNLKGKWLVYSRKAQPGATNEQTALIKSLNIISIAEDGIAYGEIVFYIADVTKTSSCQLVTKDGVIKIVTDKDIWNFYAYKADGKEFVFGEIGKLVYYSKH